MKTRFSLLVLISAFVGFIVYLIDRGGRVLIAYDRETWNIPAFEFAPGIGFCFMFFLIVAECLVLFWYKKIKQDMQSVSKGKSLMRKEDVDMALSLVLKTMTAITEGDLKEAKKHLKELKGKIGDSTIIDLLKLKILKGEKKFDEVEKLSLKLSKTQGAELVGLKAMIESSSKNKDFEKALASANQAFKTRQDLYWVIENTFRLRALSSDWDGAIEVLETAKKKKMIEHTKYLNMKAISLYEVGLQCAKNGQKMLAEKCMEQAYNLCPSFVPAALKLAEREVQNGKVRVAEKILKEVWRLNPTYDVAKAYLKLFKEESYKDLVHRMEAFALLNVTNVSLNHFILAELDMKAKLYDRAKSEFEIFLINNPATQKIAKLIAKYEKEVNKNIKAEQVWIKKEQDCAEDNVYKCPSCGRVEKHWMPFCKECGAFNLFEWFLYVKKR